MKKEPASVAARRSPATNTKSNGPAVALVLQGCEIISTGIAEVFDICVNDQHEFFANGVLVHNCIDALRYATVTGVLGRINKGHYNITIR